MNKQDAAEKMADLKSTHEAYTRTIEQQALDHEASVKAATDANAAIQANATAPGGPAAIERAAYAERASAAQAAKASE